VSIIYDALQKTQRNRANNRDSLNIKRREAWIDLSIVGIIAVLLIMVTAAYLPRVIKHFKSSAHPVVQAAAATVVTDADKVISVTPEQEFTAVAGKNGNLVLNGVLLSTDDKLAMINNRSFHQGDIIDGMRIIDIELNKVKLQDGERILVLRSAV
jgi:hypothetical protein